MNELLVSLIISYSLQFGLDPGLVLAVVDKESSGNIEAVGTKGEQGLFQLLPSSFPNFTKSELRNPMVNIPLGVAHLADAKKRCKHRLGNQWIVCYNAGVKGGSALRNPTKFAYYRMVMEKFKRGDLVIIKGWYANSLDGEGKVKWKGKKDNRPGDNWLVEVDGMVVNFSEDQLAKKETKNGD